MLARFGGPLYVTDDYIPGIYTEIFNILWLQQRLSYCSKECFAFKHLTIMTYSRINKLFINN